MKGAAATGGRGAGGGGHKGYRPEVDGLRAFAVIAVILTHMGVPPLWSGFLSVDLFFVISGYVITASLESRATRDGAAFLLGF